MPDVVLTVAGDRASIEADVDPSVPLGWMLGEWAGACSSHPAEALVMVSDDARHMFDPNATPASLGLAHGAVVRLMTAREATELIEANATTPPPAPAPAWAEHIASDPPAWGPPGAGRSPGAILRRRCNRRDGGGTRPFQGRGRPKAIRLPRARGHREGRPASNQRSHRLSGRQGTRARGSNPGRLLTFTTPMRSCRSGCPPFAASAEQ